MVNPFVKQVTEEMILDILAGEKDLSARSITYRICEKMPIYDYFKNYDMIRKTSKVIEAKVKRIANKSENIKYKGMNARYRRYSIFTEEEKKESKEIEENCNFAWDLYESLVAQGFDVGWPRGDAIPINARTLAQLVQHWQGNPKE